MTSPDPFAGAGMTALGLAASRSVESTRVDRLIDDPFARTLFEAADADLPMRLRWPSEGEAVPDSEALHLHGSRYIGLRTRFYDDVLLAGAAKSIRQAVLLGAGLDTRALRLALPEDLHLYEVDQPGVLDFKATVLTEHGIQPRCNVSRLGSDLTERWADALDEADFDPDAATVWIAEGLLPYLSEDAQTALIESVDSLSGINSELAFDQIGGGDVRDLSERSGLDMESLLLTTTGHDHVSAALTARGWDSQATATDRLAERYGRDLSDPFADPAPSAAAPPWLETNFITAQKGAPAC